MLCCDSSGLYGALHYESNWLGLHNEIELLLMAQPLQIFRAKRSIQSRLPAGLTIVMVLLNISGHLGFMYRIMIFWGSDMSIFFFLNDVQAAESLAALKANNSLLAA